MDHDAPRPELASATQEDDEYKAAGKQTLTSLELSTLYITLSVRFSADQRDLTHAPINTQTWSWFNRLDDMQTCKFGKPVSIGFTWEDAFRSNWYAT